MPHDQTAVASRLVVTWRRRAAASAVRATTGTRLCPKAMVSAVGNRTKGITMPVTCPNKVTAAGRDSPEAMSCRGIQVASTRPVREPRNRPAVMGTASRTNSRASPGSRAAPAPPSRVTAPPAARARRPATSPATTRAAASAGRTDTGRASHSSRSANTTRTTCSATWAAAGTTIAFCPRYTPRSTAETAVTGRAGASTATRAASAGSCQRARANGAAPTNTRPVRGSATTRVTNRAVAATAAGGRRPAATSWATATGMPAATSVPRLW